MRRKFSATLAAVLLAVPLVAGAAGAPAGQGLPARELQLEPLADAAVPAALREAGAARRPARGADPKPARQARPPARELSNSKLAPGLEEAMASPNRPPEFDVVIVTAGAPAADPDLARTMAELPVRRTFNRAITGFTARVTPEQVARLKAMPAVTRIDVNERVYAHLDSATRWSGAGLVRSDFLVTGNRDGNPLAYTSGDVVIAIVDTGIDTGHLDLRGKVIGWYDLVNGAPTPYDDNGHGTHVAGIAAGAGAANPALKGVASGAALVGVKVLHGDGWGTWEWVIGGVEWVLENRERYNIRVMNMSLGTRMCGDGQDALAQAVNAVVAAGIVAVVSAGNYGPDNCTTGSPAAAEGAITVGAMRDPGEGGWTLAPWSSRGPTADGRKKPDIAAPGSRITAPQAGTRDRYVTWSGTSMAAPVVTGTVALMLEANAGLSPAEVKAILAATAQDWGLRGQDVEYGWGRLNTYRAVQRVLGVRGLGPRQPTHGIGLENLVEGTSVFYRLPVTGDDLPVALTLIMPYWSSSYVDLDLYLYDPDGTLVAAAAGIDRQETIQYRPERPGDYYVEVFAFEGSGPYVLDASWK